MTAGHSVEVGHTLRIDDEQFFVTAVSTNTLTVTRGVNGSTAATHLNAAVVQAYGYPIVSEACLFQAELHFASKNAPSGISGGGEFATRINAVGLHPFVQRLLVPFRRVVIA